MSFLSNTSKGQSFAAVTPMNPIPGSNSAPNSNGIPNNANYFLCGGNEASLLTLRTSTIDAGCTLGAGSGTKDGKMDPIQGSEKLFLHGCPAIGMGDMSMTNNYNAPSPQQDLSQSKSKKNA